MFQATVRAIRANDYGGVVVSAVFLSSSLWWALFVGGLLLGFLDSMSMTSTLASLTMFVAVVSLAVWPLAKAAPSILGDRQSAIGLFVVVAFGTYALLPACLLALGSVYWLCRIAAHMMWTGELTLHDGATAEVPFLAAAFIALLGSSIAVIARFWRTTSTLRRIEGDAVRLADPTAGASRRN